MQLNKTFNKEFYKTVNNTDSCDLSVPTGRDCPTWVEKLTEILDFISTIIKSSNQIITSDKSWALALCAIVGIVLAYYLYHTVVAEWVEPVLQLVYNSCNSDILEVTKNGYTLGLQGLRMWDQWRKKNNGGSESYK